MGHSGEPAAQQLGFEVGQFRVLGDDARDGVGKSLVEGFQPCTDVGMRSRYTAFVLERGPYLLATWHASTRPASIEFEPGVKWLGLDIRSRSVLDADHAEVEFVARQRSSTGTATRLHERSRFVREGDRWFYLEGDLQTPG